MPVAAPFQTTIIESLTQSARVDREAGVIRNVKLIGFESKNGRSYPSPVLKSSVHLYEGAKVNVDHPEKGPGQPRKYGERLGVIRNVRFVEGKGNYGDFHFNPKHPMAEQVCWDAEHSPESLGFSHNATLRMGDRKNGKETVEEIVAIRSMDLVADPATTTSLFESENMGPEAPPVSEPTGTPKDQIKAAFKSMIMAAIDDDSLDMKATLKKIGEIMKSQAKLLGVAVPAETNGDGEPSEESLQLKQQVALLQQQVEQYQSQEKQSQRVRQIDEALVAEGLDPKNSQHVSDLFAKQLLATESVDDRRAMISDRAALVKAGPHKRNSFDPTYTPPVTPTTEQVDSKRWIA